MSRVGSYRDLRVYRQAFHRAMMLRDEVRSFPGHERFDLAHQIRRSSRSVCANLAEAWRRRVYPAAFSAKLIDAESEATETRVHLEFAAACGYMGPERFAEFDTAYDQILAQLVVMRSHPERWRPRAGRRMNPGRSGSAPSGGIQPPSKKGPQPGNAGPSGPEHGRTRNRNAGPTPGAPSGPTGTRPKARGAGTTRTAPSAPAGRRSRESGSPPGPGVPRQGGPT